MGLKPQVLISPALSTSGPTRGKGSQVLLPQAGVFLVVLVFSSFFAATCVWCDATVDTGPGCDAMVFTGCDATVDTGCGAMVFIVCDVTVFTGCDVTVCFQAVCCADFQHCCPAGSYCDQAAGGCTPHSQPSRTPKRWDREDLVPLGL